MRTSTTVSLLLEATPIRALCDTPTEKATRTGVATDVFSSLRHRTCHSRSLCWHVKARHVFDVAGNLNFALHAATEHSWYFRSLHGQIRALLLRYERKIGLSSSSDVLAITWLLRDASCLLPCFQIWFRQTPYMAEHQHEYHRIPCVFLVGDAGRENQKVCLLECEMRHGLMRAGFRAMSLPTSISCSRFPLARW